MDFIPKDIEQYASEHSDVESPLLHEIYRETHLKFLMPRMLSGHIQGRFLGFMAAIHGAKNIIEIGSFTGYAALAMAEATPDDCQIHCLEKDEEIYEALQRNIQKSAYKHRMKSYLGNALEILENMDFQADFIFLDADKVNYPMYYPLIKKRLKPEGILIVDNVLWSGKVLHSEDNKDRETSAIHQFNTMVQNDPEVSNVLLPLRDGLMLIRKKTH